MRFAQVTQSLNHVLDILQPLIQANHIEIDNDLQEISWRNRIRGIAKDVYYPIEYQHLIDTHQYSLLLTNGAFFQFYYGFKADGTPKSVRLAYYPSPVSTKETVEEILDAADGALDRSEDELYEHLFNWVELMEAKELHPANTSHVRFDYDDKVEVHEKAHIQFGAVTEFRIGADVIALPYSFVELVGGLIEGLGDFEAAHLAHSRNNCGRLGAVARLLSIRHTNP